MQVIKSEIIDENLDIVAAEVASSISEEETSLSTTTYETVMEINAESTEHISKNEIILYEAGDNLPFNVLNNKKLEIESIQKDLGVLIAQLNDFVDSQTEWGQSVAIEQVHSDSEDEVDDEEEKKDGPQEKDQIALYKPDNLYVCDGINPPEVNWEVLAPFIQNTVSDLQTISNLNMKMSNVINRVRNITREQKN